MLKEGIVPIEVREAVVEVLPALRDLGRRLHIQATYGDEDSYTPPWDLFAEYPKGDEEKAQAVLYAARQSVAAARQVYRLMFELRADD